MLPQFQHLIELRQWNLVSLTHLSRAETLQLLKTARWGKTDNPNEVVCPRCGKRHIAYWIESRQQWQCKHCHYRFSITARTVFANHKISLCKILVCLFAFSISPKGIPATHIAEMLGIQYKHAWVMLHKLRETLNIVKDLTALQGEVHIDGAYANIYIRPKNFKHRRIDRRARRHQREDKSCLMTFRQKSADYSKMRGAERTIVAHIKEENVADVWELTHKFVKPNSKVCTDENPAYDKLAIDYDLWRVNHSQEYCSIDGTTNNLAESFFARFKRSLKGVYHKMKDKYIMLYGNEMAWREDTRRLHSAERLSLLLGYCMELPPSPDFTNYARGNRRANTVYGIESVVGCKAHRTLLGL